MDIQKIILKVVKFFEEFLNKPGSVISICQEEDKWKVNIEVIEESEYLRAYAKHDFLAIYEVTLDKNINITGYARKSMRDRNKLAD